ncbi:MAG: c-type cytochrome [Candidatus Kapabacteria bacterium]|nr:c-type cytochrome [Candidatus Kapabacteria bacterium]
MTDITALIRRASLVILGIGTAAAVIAMCPTRPDTTVRRGAEVYQEYCIRCHGDAGQGVGGVRRINDRHLWNGPIDSVIVTLAYGAKARRDGSYLDDRRLTMPPIPYGDADIAAVTSYLYETFKGRRIDVDANDVRAVKDRHRATLLERMR